MQKHKYDYLFKLVLIGDSAVGKSSLLLRFADNKFNENYMSTIGVDFRFKTIKVNGKVVKLQIWDTAGQERFKTITSAYYKGADGIMMVYDSGNKESFESLDNWLFEVEKHAAPTVAKTIVANKADIETKQVPKELGAEYAAKNKIMFIETSAKKDFQVSTAFEKLAEKLIETKRMKTPQKEVTININVNQTIKGGVKTMRDKMQQCCQY